MVKSSERTLFGLPYEGRVAIKRVLRETMPSRWKLFAKSVVTMVGVALFTSALAYSTKLIVNDVFVDGNTTQAWKVALLVVFVAAGKSLFGYYNSIFSLQFSRSISSEFKRRIFAKLIDGNVREVTTVNSAKQMGQLRLFSGSASTVVVSLTNKLATDVLTLLALVGVMVLQDPVMSLFAGILFPVIFYIVTKLTRKIRTLAGAEAEMEGALYAVGGEALDGIKTVKSYGLEAKSKTRFKDAVEKVEKRILKIGKIASITMPLMEAIGGLVIGMFVIYASWQTISNGKTPGEFAAFITAFLLAYQPAERISKTWVSIQKNVLHLERMYRIFDRPDDHYDEDSDRLVGVSSSLEFDNVVHTYGDKTTALNGVSFFIKPGERIAIVGRSGSGKTTLVDLVLDFCVPTSGSVKIGGVDTKDVANNEIRKNVALISQEVFLFDATIADNIRDGNPSMSDAEVFDVAQRAATGDFAGSLSDLQETNIGHAGVGLSGGQRQRIAIARAFAKHAKIYIFDEATSALDGENERAIMATAVGNYMESTMLFVSHRASTLDWVDRVIFLENGRIAGFDTHEKLRAKSENYRSLFQMEKSETAK